MKILSEVSAEKVRGGFYSPPGLVRQCYERIAELTTGRSNLKLLEPGAGNGAFLRGLQANRLSDRFNAVLAIELLESEAAQCRVVAQELATDTIVQCESVLTWAVQSSAEFDVLVGNPPYVRYQFIGADDKRLIPEIGERTGLSFAGVSNLWIPFLIASLSHLATSGAFAVIVPTEILTGVSAGLVRKWLISHVKDLRMDLYPVGSFPGVLQEVLVLSGRRGLGDGHLTFVEHDPSDGSRTWQHLMDRRRVNWTAYLLDPRQLDAIEEGASLDVVSRLGSVARFEVAAVTGANEYFSVSRSVAQRYELLEWSRWLLPRLRHARGLRYTTDDQLELVDAGARAYLLDFAKSRPTPEGRDLPEMYFELGRAAGIPERYKCRIRSPWYRVPHIGSGRLMLSKRAHRYHRMVLNEANVVTTDTIYRGVMRTGWERRDLDLVSSFHNSLTMLSAELEGRSFGGGVLELVPTEIARLDVPLVTGFGDQLDELDELTRRMSQSEDCDDLIVASNRRLAARDVGLNERLLSTLEEARQVLLQRRLDRTRGSEDAVEVPA